MGLFLAMSGVIGAESNDVKDVLSNFAQSKSGGFELAQGTVDAPNIGIITQDGPNTTVMFPDGFCEWDEVSKEISLKLAKPVFSLHIHDGDLWMFVLFQNGKEIGWFNPHPEYWKNLSPEEKEKWKGDATLVAEIIQDISIDSIDKYFVEWDLENADPPKAYPDDKFTFGDCWQMCDFMKKIGLKFPVGDDGTIHGETFLFWMKGFRLRKKQPAPDPPKPKKPWWKFW